VSLNYNIKDIYESFSFRLSVRGFRGIERVNKGCAGEVGGKRERGGKWKSGGKRMQYMRCRE